MIESLVSKHTALIAHWASRRVSKGIWLPVSRVAGRTDVPESCNTMASTYKYRANNCRAWICTGQGELGLMFLKGGVCPVGS